MAGDLYLCAVLILTSLYLLLLIFFAAIGIQIVYFILFSTAFNRSHSGTSTEALPVSVIVCSHDEEQNLTELIPQLLKQNHPSFEVIIVNDRSNDSTFDMLLAEAGKDHRLRMVHVNRTPPHVDNKKYAITLGIKAARYEWILLTDADCRPTSDNWISTMSKHFSDQTNFVLGYSPYLKLAGFLNTFIRFESLLTAIQYLSFGLLGAPYMGVGRNMAYRRSRFLDLKGFNNILHITGGDDDLYVNQHATASTTQYCIEPEAQVTSIPKKTWGEFYRQKIRHLSVGKRYKFGHRFMLGMFMFTWILSWFTGILALPFAFTPDPEVIPHAGIIVIGLLLLRTVILILIVVHTSKKLNQKFEWWAIPVLDFIYAFYYLVAGLQALVTKKVRWKN